MGKKQRKCKTEKNTERVGKPTGEKKGTEEKGLDKKKGRKRRWGGRGIRTDHIQNSR